MDADDDPVLAKILAMAFLGVSSFVVGSTPVCVFERLGIRRRARGAANAVLRLILNFGGGVLLCTTFLHLLPEVREGVERLTADGTVDPSQPVAGLLAELIMCVGFFVMFSVEELVHGFGGDHHHHHHDHDHSHQQKQHHHGREHEDQQHHHHHHHHHHHQQQQHDGAALADGHHHHAAAVNGATTGQQNPAFEKNEAAVVSGRVANYNSCTSVVEIAAAKKPDEHAQHEHEDHEQQQQHRSTAVFRGFLVVGALSIHELFEGLAVGLEKNATQVWSLTVAVACHKLVIAFYVGLQMLSDRTKPLLAHCSILLFAVTSPIGIGVGTVVSNLEETNSVVILSVILQGLATGTLMYVVFFEVLKPSVEHLNVKQRILRLLFIAIGFMSMLSIQLILTE